MVGTGAVIDVSVGEQDALELFHVEMQFLQLADHGVGSLLDPAIDENHPR